MDTPNKLVVNYIFSSDHEDSDVSWLLRKLDRYNNGSMYSSELYPSGSCFTDTPTPKKLSPKGVGDHPTTASPAMKKQLLFPDQTGQDVADEYISSYVHEKSDVAWLLRMLDDNNNGVSASSESSTTSTPVETPATESASMPSTSV